MGMKKYGDWTKAGIVLNSITKNLYPMFQAVIDESGNIALKRMKEHIERQDLNWKPLSEYTIKRKGNDTIYVETGFLKDNLAVRKIKSKKDEYNIFIGASAWKRNKEGIKLSDLMIWLEYGTNKIPPRPLIRPTWIEIEPIIKELFEKELKQYISRGGKF